MASPEDKAEQDRLLDWLRTPTGQAAEDDDLAATIRRNLSARNPSRGRPGPAWRGRAPDDAFVRALLPPTRQADRGDWDDARQWAGGWRDAGVSADQIGAWLRAGVGPHEGALAGLLLWEGISSVRATEVYSHPNTAQPMTVVELARDGTRYWDHTGTALCEALDAAQVERERRPAAGRPLWGRRPTA
jgi:hypothetical protein